MAETATEKKPAASKPKTTAQVGKAYFGAIADRDFKAAAAMWKPGSIDHLHGLADLRAPQDVVTYFENMVKAFPDFDFEVVEICASGKNAACRWRLRATFDGTAKFQGIAPTGARVELEGCDMLRVEDGLILENNAYVNGQQLAEQLGVMPPLDSAPGRAMVGAFNAKTAATGAIRKLRNR